VDSLQKTQHTNSDRSFLQLNESEWKKSSSENDSSEHCCNCKKTKLAGWSCFPFGAEIMLEMKYGRQHNKQK